MDKRDCDQPAENEQAAPYDAIFFDMDGTLLPMDVPEFLRRYYEVLAQSCTRQGIDAHLFQPALNAGLAAMSSHGPEITNEQAFWDVFLAQYQPQGKCIDADERRSLERFIEDFYQGDFDQVGADIEANPAAQQAVRTLRDKGYPLYLTTMPLFPRTGVVQRLKWAGVDPALFARITTFANSTATKPHVAYCHENLAIAGAAEAPGRVLMVGNDTTDDLVALEAGMDAYLVTDHLINKNGFDIETVKHGTLAGFAQFAASLPTCASTRALKGDPNRCILEDGPAAIASNETGR